MTADARIFRISLRNLTHRIFWLFELCNIARPSQQQLSCCFFALYSHSMNRPVILKSTHESHLPFTFFKLPNLEVIEINPFLAQLFYKTNAAFTVFSATATWPNSHQYSALLTVNVPGRRAGTLTDRGPNVTGSKRRRRRRLSAARCCRRRRPRRRYSSTWVRPASCRRAHHRSSAATTNACRLATGERSADCLTTSSTGSDSPSASRTKPQAFNRGRGVRGRGLSWREN